MSEPQRGMALAELASTLRFADLPEPVVKAAATALLDYCAVTIGGHNEPSAKACRALVDNWKIPGRAPIFLGSPTLPAFAALANGTAAQALDFDDAHFSGGGHISAVCWPVALGLAAQHDLDGQRAITTSWPATKWWPGWAAADRADSARPFRNVAFIPPGSMVP